MKKLTLFLLAQGLSFGHSLHIHQPSDINVSTDFGGFAHISYRNSDLYPKGIEQGYGYENHGDVDKINIEHLGIYFNKKMGNVAVNLELNHHIGANWTPNELVEKANVVYFDGRYGITFGRDYNNISFVREKNWGYGFIQMPLAVDSLFDKTHSIDGIFGSYKMGGFSLKGDFGADQYGHKQRRTLRGSYLYENIELITYYQQRNTTKSRVDFSAVTHSHSHGSGCDGMTTNELCIENEATVFGVGAKVNFGNRYELLGEYLQYESKGGIETNQYIITHETIIQSAYLQLISTNERFNYGLRGEYFWYDTTLDGSGATAVATLMNLDDGNEAIKYLYTLNVNYNITTAQNIALEIKKSDLNTAVRVNYLLRF